MQRLLRLSQYTIRKIPAAIDHELRERARRKGISLNEATLEAIRTRLGLSETEVEFDDMNDLAGTWKQDDEFDQAIADQDMVDPDAWQ